MPNIKLTLAYDGGAYHGWQKTHMLNSIEEILQAVLEKILQEKFYLQAASRTDAGVHAQGQIVNFITKHEYLNLACLKISLNRLLPKDIAVMDIEMAADTFHPTLACLAKEYHYTLCYGRAQLPQTRHYAWHYPRLLDLSLMRKASECFVGEHDFSTFCNLRRTQTYDSHIRHIHWIMITEEENEQIKIKIKGNNFLYKMVRNIVGTLAYVGSGKILLEDLPAIIASHKRAKAGIAAPAHGLCLYKVYYEPNDNET